MNKLLVETGENTKLLQAQNEDLQSKLSRAEDRVRRGQEAEANLASAQSQLRKWQGLCKQVLTPEEVMQCQGAYSHSVMAQKLAEMQQSVVDAKVKLQEQQGMSRYGSFLPTNT